MQTIEYSYGTKWWYRVGVLAQVGPHVRAYFRQYQRGCSKYLPHQGAKEMKRRAKS